MKLLDANVLLFAVNTDAREHKIARTWLEGALSAGEPVAFAWIAILAFLRIATRRGLLHRPLTPSQAFAVLQAWLQRDHVHILHPTKNHLHLLHRLLERSGSAGNLTNDAHLAALALEHGAAVVSFDRDFARFENLRVETLSL